MIKWSSKIIAFCYIAIYFLSAIHPFQASDGWETSTIFAVSNQFLIALERNQDSTNGIASGTNQDFNLIKFTPVARLGIKPIVRSFDFLLKKYIRYNELDYNRPLICFKFPLNEHTEAG